jgi:REase_DpnII-MboI
MSDINLYLIEDIELTIKRQIDSIRGSSDLVEAYIEWLVGDTEIEYANLQALALSSATKKGAQRTYRDIAIMGFGMVYSQNIQDINSALKDGLLWMHKRKSYSPETLPDYAVDGLALLGIAQGILFCAQWEFYQEVRIWIIEIIKASLEQGRLNEWDKALIAIADFLIRGLNPSLSLQNTFPDLLVALSTRISLDVNSDIEEKAFSIVLSSIKSEQGVERSATQLAALKWLKRKAPKILPGQAKVSDVIELLQGVPRSLRRWCWEDKPRSKKRDAKPITWDIQSEYHVQDLIWVILSPIFPDLEDEENLPSLGQKHPRYDLGIPSLGLIIEIKFAYEGLSSEFANIIEGVAADTSLYLSERSGYNKVLAFVWDNSRRTEQHSELKHGLGKIRDVVGAIVVSRPGKMG